MPFQLVLTIEYSTDTHWRWVLADAAGRFLADQEVSLDTADPVYESFQDLPGRLHFFEGIRPAEDVLAELGAWMGKNVFGAVGEKLLAYEQSPACVVQVRVPPEAQNLLFRPFELAYLDGKPFAERGFRLIYTVARESDYKPARAALKDSGKLETLRVLGVFSLPHDETPLNLRQERHRLQQLVREFVQTRGRAVELRLLQYGATRDLLTEVIQEAPGWDVMHFSGHGIEGELILEKLDGTADRIAADELAKLLRPAHARLKLLTLSACYSGAADLRAARAQIDLEEMPALATAPQPSANVLPSLGQRLAEELDCAVLAMRYPVLDDFATELALTLYDRMLEKRQPLPQALELAMAEALHPKHDPYLPTFSRSTPLLFGERAADLRLQAPQRPPSFELPKTGLFYFPPQPERFVGRLMPMLRAREALAPESDKTGVLFYGMAGAGKTACALELAYGYDPQNVERFTGFVWHKAPEEGHEIADALTQFALSMEKQLPGLELVGLMDDPQEFKNKALPGLRGLLQNNAILLVIDNLEGLLTSQGDWRDARWGELINALLDHKGTSRLVITSRRLPNTLKNHSRLQADAIHALSFQESLLLARSLSNLKGLFKNASGREKLQRISRAAQGHPKLLELADGMAVDPAALDAHLARTESASGDRDATRIAFFRTGETDRPEDIFVEELHRWTEGVAENLSTTARLLAQFLARLEDEDRTMGIVQANWKDFLKRLTGERGEEKQPAPEPACKWAQGALSEPGLGLEDALNQLAQAGLIEIEAITSQRELITPESLQTLLPILAAQNPEVAAMLADPQGVNLQDLLPHIQAALDNPSHPALQTWLNDQLASMTTQQFHIHPGVAEALLSPLPFVSNAVDTEMGDYFIAVSQHGLKTEMQGGGRLVVEGARHAAPYLMRAERWKEAAFVLERMILRDTSPATLALTIPLLRQIVVKLENTAQGLETVVVLANALSEVGRYAEAEIKLRDVITNCVEQGNYMVASGASGILFNLLRDTGRFEEALRTAEEMPVYTQRAGLGAWSRLLDEGRRLQALNSLGRYSEVLAAVEQHLGQMEDLQEENPTKESVDPWNVREVILNTGYFAARDLEQWETALAFNAEIVDYTRKRGADKVWIAQMHYNDYFPLLRLRRYGEARSVLEDCRTVFEGANSVYGLSDVYTALADLENEEGHTASAARFEQAALRYTYQIGRPEGCAISHNNLALYIEGAEGGVPEAALAHQLAASIICFQISSGMLSKTIRNLVGSPLPPTPPSFAQVCELVEQIEGVRFREMFERLPKREPDGDAAIQVVWEMALEEAKRIKDEQDEG
ncbi:MAG TPA: CHAT domain-containing protein [Blastocatellia bacterium]|nr:CHAT domain-containing protein [Blastocatellia bacterium]